MSHDVLFGGNAEPSHSNHVFVDHEAEGVGDVAFEGLGREVDTSDSLLSFEEVAKRSDYIGSGCMNFEIIFLVFSVFGDVAVDVDSLDNL